MKTRIAPWISDEILDLVFNKYSYENLYDNETGYYYVPEELINNEYITNNINVIHNPRHGEDIWDNWVYSNSITKILKYCIGITCQEYYDIAFLHIKYIEDRPKCPTCGDYVLFRRLQLGYHEYCSHSCTLKYLISHPEIYGRMTKPHVVTYDEYYSKFPHKNHNEYELINSASLKNKCYYNEEYYNNGYGYYYLIPGSLITKEIKYGNELLIPGKDVYTFSASLSPILSIMLCETGEFDYDLYPSGPSQYYYDHLIMGWKDPEVERPRCKNCGCQLSFKCISCGYQSTDNVQKNAFCSNPCTHQYIVSHPDEYPKFAESQLNKSLGVSHIKLSKKLNKEFHLRSSYEDWLIDWFDSNKNVSNLEYESESIKYINPIKNKISIYIPDFKFDWNGITYLIEIKPEAYREDPINQAKFAAAKEYCNTKGWIFDIWTEYDF